MTQTRQVRLAAIAGAAVAISAFMTGCMVEKHKDGDSDKVRISTPFGGMSVKTNDAANQSNLGLDLYPGAVLEKKRKGDDGAADISMSFGDFHLGVKAATYLTTDSPSKVKAYYEKSLAKHGTVIECQNNKTIGPVTRTQDGLTCNDDNKHTIQLEEKADRGQIELKFGSKQHQHIVSIEEKEAAPRLDWWRWTCRATSTSKKMTATAVEDGGRYNDGMSEYLPVGFCHRCGGELAGHAVTDESGYFARTAALRRFCCRSTCDRSLPR